MSHHSQCPARIDEWLYQCECYEIEREEYLDQVDQEYERHREALEDIGRGEW